MADPGMPLTSTETKTKVAPPESIPSVEELDDQREEQITSLVAAMSQWLNDGNTDNNSPAIDCPELWEKAYNLIKTFAGIRSEDRRIRMELQLLEVRDEWVDGEIHMLENYGGPYETGNEDGDEKELSWEEKNRRVRQKRIQIMNLRHALKQELKRVHHPAKLEMNHAQLINLIAILEHDNDRLEREKEEGSIVHNNLSGENAVLNEENLKLNDQNGKLMERIEMLEKKMAKAIEELKLPRLD